MTEENPHDGNGTNSDGNQQDEPAEFATPDTAGELDGDQPGVGERPDLEDQKKRLRKRREQEAAEERGPRDLSDTGTGDPSVDSVEQTINRLHSQGHAVIHDSQEEAAQAAIGRMDEGAPKGTNDAPEAVNGEQPPDSNQTAENETEQNAENGAQSAPDDDRMQPTGDQQNSAHGDTREREQSGTEQATDGGGVGTGNGQLTPTKQAETVEPTTEQSDGADESDPASENPRQREPKTYAQRAEDEGVDDSADRVDGGGDGGGGDDHDRPEYETRTADELSVEELADPNEEWTLGKEQEALVLDYEGMLTKFSEPEHEDEIINAIRDLDEDDQGDPHSRQRAIAQVIISFPNLSDPRLTDTRWEKGLTPAQRLQLGNIASGYLNASDFTVESGDMPNPQQG